MQDPPLSKRVDLPNWVVKALECVVVLGFFASGVLLIQDALSHHHDHAQGTRGTLLVFGMICCAWLLWKRRNENGNSLVWIGFVFSLSNSVEKGMKWMSDGIHPPLSVRWFALTVVFFALVVFDIWTRRKKPEIERDYETARFEPEDKL